VNNYAGTVTFTAAASSSSFVGCYGISNTAVTAGGTASATLTIYTAAANCSTASQRHVFARPRATAASQPHGPAPRINPRWLSPDYSVSCFWVRCESAQDYLPSWQWPSSRVSLGLASDVMAFRLYCHHSYRNLHHYRYWDGQKQ
jgi:hypothetical protein